LIVQASFLNFEIEIQKEQHEKQEKGVNESASRSRAYVRRIFINPKVPIGKPIINGMRVSVEPLLELLGNGWTHEQIFKKKEFTS